MKKWLILAVMALGMSATAVPALAKNENASVGTKELLERIEALEAAVENLGGGTSDVSDRTYHTYTFVHNIGALTNGPTGHMAIVGSIVREMSFHGDGTGFWAIASCESNQLSAFNANPPSIGPVTCAALGSGVAFTWTQAGNEVELTLPGLILSGSVSSDGSIITLMTGGVTTLPTITVAGGALTVGVLVDD